MMNETNLRNIKSKKLVKSDVDTSILFHVCRGWHQIMSVFVAKLTTIVDYFPRAKTKYGEIHHATSLFNKTQISAYDRRKIHVKNTILNIHLKKINSMMKVQTGFDLNV